MEFQEIIENIDGDAFHLVPLNIYKLIVPSLLL